MLFYQNGNAALIADPVLLNGPSATNLSYANVTDIFWYPDPLLSKSIVPTDTGYAFLSLTP